MNTNRRLHAYTYSDNGEITITRESTIVRDSVTGYSFKMLKLHYHTSDIHVFIQRIENSRKRYTYEIEIEFDNPYNPQQMRFKMTRDINELYEFVYRHVSGILRAKENMVNYKG